MADQTKTLQRVGGVSLVLGLIVGSLPANLGGTVVAGCGSAWFRGWASPGCTAALMMPTVFSVMLAAVGVTLLVAGALMQQNRK